MIARLRSVGRFWYDFVVGDDWHVAVGVVLALGLTFAISRRAEPAWWAPPLGVGLLLPYSLARAVRRHRAPSPGLDDQAAPR